VLAPLLQSVHQRLVARGVVTFQGLLTGAHRLLGRHPWIRRRVRSELRQLLVDEFQDTDRLQCEIIAHLTLGGGDGERPGLFVVGDPKQLIYGWRDADLEAYEEFVEAMQDHGGLVFRLSVNYRSVPAVLDEVARVVGPVMEAERGIQPAFELLLPCPDKEQAPGFCEDPWAVVEHWLSWAEGSEVGVPAPGTAAASYETEARAVARDLVSLHERAGVAWSEFGLLLRSTGDVDVVLQALREAGVPYSVTRDREYFRRREIVEAAAFVRCVLDPGDQVALLTVLRSDAVGVPDAALIPLWQAGFPSLMVDLRAPDDGLAAVTAAVRFAAGHLPVQVPGIERLPHWDQALLAAVESIALLRVAFATEPADVFVERVRSLHLAEATAAARYLGHHRHARLEAFFLELERLLIEGDGQRSEVARFLRRAVELGQESDEPVVAGVDADAVQVMTIHRAKGLDFGHLYLLQSGRRDTGVRGGAVTAVRHRGTTPEFALFGWPTPGFQELQRRAAQVERAERVRLLYVAMTRARERLVIAGRWPQQPKPRSLDTARCMLDLLLHRGADQPLADQAAAGSERRADGGAQWVLVDRIHPDAGVVPSLAAGDSPSPAAVWREAERLHGARAAARERMARPVAAAASWHARRAELEGEEQEGWARRGPTRRIAATVGTAVHRVLEQLDLDGDLRKQLEAGRVRESARLEAELAGPELAAACEELDAVVAGVASGRWLRRLREIAPGVVARELPALLPAAGDDGPVGYVSARIDLVYRDPATGELVIADYKTDRLDGATALVERVELYRPQAELYARAVADALRLAEPPAVELWFLTQNRIVRVPEPAGAAG
jgi:ATP-dependent exoDNAse (exonuclease V) beta subunit